VINHLKYLKFLLKHKWFVFLECKKLGISWRGLKHDMGKFRPKLFKAYSRRFANGNNYHGDLGLEYRMAYNKHLLRSDHHWQHWGIIRDSGEVHYLPMSDRARKEFLAELRGNSRLYGTNTANWYEAHQNEIFLHLETKKWLEEQLGFYRVGGQLCRIQ
jgi:hypothetical protein